MGFEGWRGEGGLGDEGLVVVVEEESNPEPFKLMYTATLIQTEFGLDWAWTKIKSQLFSLEI